METLDYNPKHWEQACPKYDCRKNKCKCGMSYVNIPAVLGSDTGSSPVAPKNGAYCNTIVKYEANGNVYAYSKDGIPVFLGSENSRLVAEKMMVTFTSAPEGSEYNYIWSSDYSFEELSKNPDNIRVGVPQLWLCAGDTSDVIPERVSVMDGGIRVDVSVEGYRYTYEIIKPVSKNGVTINPGWFGGGKVLKNSVDVIVLPQLELAYPATEIPDGTTYVTSTYVDKNMYNANTSDCMPLEQTITGHFIILPVRRNINSGGYGWVIEECLITEVSHPWTGNTYRYKTFCFNGQKYKMTYTSMSGNNITWTINKIIPGIPTPLIISNADTASWIVPGDNVEMGIKWRQGDIISEDLTFVDSNTSASLTLNDLFNRLKNGEQFILTVPFDSLAANESIWGSRDTMGESTVYIGIGNKSKNIVLENGVTSTAEIYSGITTSIITFTHYDNNTTYGGYAQAGIGRIGDKYIFTTHVSGYDFN